MKNDRIDKVCIVNTVFALLAYLAITSKDEQERTFFFMSSGISPSIRAKFNSNMYYLAPPKYKGNLIYAYIFALRLKKFWKWRFMDKVDIFAQDHLFYSSVLIGKKKYTLLTDGPFFLNAFTKTNFYKEQIAFNEGNGIFKRIKRSLAYFIAGNIWNNSHARNKQCSEIIVSEYECPPYVETTNIRKIDFSSISEFDLTRIIDLFDLTHSQIFEIKSKSIIILTQPFSSDKLITEEEHAFIYQSILKNYPIDNVIIKKHPRDLFDYRKYFKNVYIMDKPVPMQLLDILNIKFTEAVTVCSSSVYSIPYEIKITWIGASIHPSLLKEFGDVHLIDKLT